MNFNGIAFGNSLTSISKDAIFARSIKCQELKFTATSSAKITCDDFMTITFDTVNNVHFYNTPYIDCHKSYLAREKWCYENFALITHSHSNYLTKSDANTSYAPKEHSHPKYTTESEVRSIVRSMVKSSALK